MKFAVNYSPEAIRLFSTKKISYDLLKLPAWPQIIKQVAGKIPCYVHFPLKAGRGLGVIDNETKQPVRWKKVEKILRQTGTPLVNLHIELAARHFPDIPQKSNESGHFTQLLESVLRDVREAVKQFGPETIIIENEHDGKGRNLSLNTSPALYHAIIAETGCGFLLDVSHARLAARSLKTDEKEYLSALPTGHIRELHVTGIQWFGDEHVKKVRAAGLEESWIERVSDHWMDHLPLTREDWPVIEWMLDQINAGVWSQPWVAALEYGGLGGFFGAFSDEQVMLEQIPPLYKMVHRSA